MRWMHDGSIGFPNSKRRGGDMAVDHAEFLEEMGSASSVGDDVSSASSAGTGGSGRPQRGTCDKGSANSQVGCEDGKVR
jgi:hypothetical protein